MNEKEHNEAEDGRRIRRDIVLSGLIGPLQVGIPVVAQFILYPVILHRSGLDVLGLWGLIATVAAYMSLFEVGFSDLIARAVASSKEDAALDEVARDHRASVRFYLVVTAVLVVGWLFAADAVLADSEVPYSHAALTWVVAVNVVAVGLMLVAKLDGAVLTGFHHTYAAQAVRGAVPVIRYSFATVGALMELPLEGFALGSLVAELFEFGAYRILLRRLASSWTRRRGSSAKGGLSEIRDLMGRGIHFYLLNVGQLLRGALFRAVVAAAIGLEAVGVFEIADRLPAAVRRLAVTGARSLFPSFAYLRQGRDRVARTRRLVRQATGGLIATAWTMLALCGVAAAPILTIWVGEFPSELVPATQLMTAFYAVTVLNVPFWYLLLATGHERDASRAIWLHTACIVILFPISSQVSFTLVGMTWYWLLTSLIGEVAIYIAAELKQGVFIASVASPIVLRLIVGVVASGVAGSLMLHLAREAGASALLQLLATAGGLGLAFALLVLPHLWPQLIRLLRASRGTPK